MSSSLNQGSMAPGSLNLNDGAKRTSEAPAKVSVEVTGAQADVAIEPVTVQHPTAQDLATAPPQAGTPALKEVPRP